MLLRALTLVTYSLITPVSAVAEGEGSPVRFCRLKAPLAIHAFVAESKKIFDKHKLSVLFTPVQQAKICLDEMRAGRIDAFIAAESVLNFQDPHEANFSIVARLTRGPYTTVVTNSLSSVEKLRGKMIGVLPGTASQLFVLMLLHDHHIPFQEVTFVPLQPAGWSSALIGGTIDAASAFEPFASVALKALGNKGYRLDGRYKSDGLLVLSRDFIKHHREEVMSLIESFKESERVISTSFNEAREIVAGQTGDRMDRIADNIKLFSFQVTLDHSSLSIMHENAELLSHLSSVDGKELKSYKYRDLFDPSLLIALDPSTVNNFK
jgi:ABC-type nitrate/sulfonate/bicarbonate transport system substrate-binding protein